MFPHCASKPETGAGPASRLPDTLALAAAESALDGAVLDVRLGCGMVFPLADALLDRGVPIVFVTGYQRWFLPEAYAQMPCCVKPLDMERLNGALSGLVRCAAPP